MLNAEAMPPFIDVMGASHVPRQDTTPLSFGATAMLAERSRGREMPMTTPYLMAFVCFLKGRKAGGTGAGSRRILRVRPDRIYGISTRPALRGNRLV